MAGSLLAKTASANAVDLQHGHKRRFGLGLRLR
jgi:hypothetical protein